MTADRFNLTTSQLRSLFHTDSEYGNEESKNCNDSYEIPKKMKRLYIEDD